MKCTAALATISGAAAFITPTPFNGAQLARQATSSSSSLTMDFSKEVGVQVPLGYWDPLGLLKEATPAQFERLRYCEVKHGRIAMIAVLGHLVQQNWRFPGMLSIKDNIAFADVPNGMAAWSVVPAAGALQILAFIGIMELFIMKQVEGSHPGDMQRFAGTKDKEVWNSWDQATKDRKLAIELNNGRAAQMGILGLIVHEQINGQPYVFNDLFGIPYTWN